jgi:hypothetical protein
MEQAAIGFLTLALSTAAYAADNLSEIADGLRRSSESLEASVAYKQVTDSLYKQIRQRAYVTDKSLSAPQIDERVYDYVAKQYVPALVSNYAHLYASMKKSGKEFSNCDAPAAFNEGDDILKALCIDRTDDAVVVKYMTNSYAQGWQSTSMFEFTQVSGKYWLTAIDILMKEGQKAHVDGI